MTLTVQNNHVTDISQLSTELTLKKAVEIAYGEDLNWIESKLRQRLSVLVETDKALVTYFYVILRDWLKDAGRGVPVPCEFLAGRSRSPDGRPCGIISRMLGELAERVASGEVHKILVLPHLDLLTTYQGGLGVEAREAIAWFYENPDITILGFKDTSFTIPQSVTNFFPAKRSIIGIPRDRLKYLILQREARKFGVDKFSYFSLYKYVSGVNAVRFREIMDSISKRIDFDPVNPSTRDAIFKDIREMTLCSDFEMPRVDMDRDIGGYEEVKDKIKKNIIDLYMARDQESNPEKMKLYEQLLPKGIIFSGPPGTGKTLFAKAIASSLDAVLIVISGPELKSKWVGESEANLRRIFMQARRSAPSVIVFDEIDAFASARGMYQGSGVEHSMVNQLLAEMDGFRKEELVLVIATTNFIASLDPALLRPGRFELQIEIPYPSEIDRRTILRIYNERFSLNLSEELFEFIIERSGGYADTERQIRFSGDHLAGLSRALARAKIHKRGELSREDVIKALASKNIPQLTPEEQRVLACHEAGHALAAALLPSASSIEKVTIVTDDCDTLGFLIQEVRKNKYVVKEHEIHDDIGVLLAGRVSERLLEGEASVGAYDDLVKATELSRLMVEELGMCGDMTPRVYKGVAGEKANLSFQTQERIDRAIEEILKKQEERVSELFIQYKSVLADLAGTLLEKKSLSKSQVEALIKKHGLKDIKEGG